MHTYCRDMVNVLQALDTLFSTNATNIIWRKKSIKIKFRSALFILKISLHFSCTQTFHSLHTTIFVIALHTGNCNSKTCNTKLSFKPPQFIIAWQIHLQNGTSQTSSTHNLTLALKSSHQSHEVPLTFISYQSQQYYRKHLHIIMANKWVFTSLNYSWCRINITSTNRIMEQEREVKEMRFSNDYDVNKYMAFLDTTRLNWGFIYSSH